MYKVDYKKYLLVLAITAAIFAMAVYVSNRLNNAKLAEIRAIQDNIAVDLLSSEMTFSLLAESSCEDHGKSALGKELDNLGAKLSYAEQNINTDEEEILWLKKNYSLFEMRDYLLNKELERNCGFIPASILYFYSNEGDCENCRKQGIALTELRKLYPGVRVYSFDYHLDLLALQTLIDIHKVDGEKLPALVINRKPYYGYQSIEDIEASIQGIESLAATSTQEAE